MKQFYRRIFYFAGAILIVAALVGINADQAIAQSKARKGAKILTGGSPSISTASTIISPRDSASGLPTIRRVEKAAAKSTSSSKNELTIETLELSGRRNYPQGVKVQISTTDCRSRRMLGPKR